MFAEFSSLGTLLSVGMLFSIAMFVAGCAVGVWFTRTGANGQAKSGSTKEHDAATARAFERAMMAADRIRDLTRHAVNHVGDHGSKVEAFTSDVKLIAEQQANVSTDALLLTIGQMTCANNELQQRLSRIEQQIAAQSAELRTCSSEARTDSLTGLANRRAFDDEIQRRFAEWQRRRTPFSLMILDVDNFKNVNDTCGHQAGDEALRQLGQAITNNSRQMDFRCRYGGDEFVVIFPDTGAQETREAAERIRSAIEKIVVRNGDKALSLSCSLGVARVESKDDVARLVRRADEALYKAKDAGRNLGYWHDGQQSLPFSQASGTYAGSTQVPLLDSLSNRQAFVDALTRRLPESQRFGIPLSIIQLRVGDYASLCEKYGEAAAQTALEAVAAFTQPALRQIDLLALVGGGEFAVMLPGSTRNEANQIAKRLHMAAANCDARIRNERVPVRVVHGIAEFRPGDTAETMMARSRLAADSEIAEPAISC